MTMDASLLSCGYSYHMEPFITGDKGGLPSFLFRLQTEGSSKALVNGRMELIQAGDLLLYRPGDPYELRIEQDDPAGKISSGDYYLFCQGQWIEDWWKRSAKPQRSRIDPDDRLLSLWRQLILEKRKMQEEEQEFSGYLLRALCLYLGRAINEQVTLQGHAFTGMRMKRYIEEHATEALKVEDVAKHVSLSVSRSIHLFKECFGMTIIQYANDIRLTIALERIRYSFMTLEQVAESCGFGSYPYFHRAFKEKYGVSPNVYRSL
jgi:AraC family transcriptional regulator, arabinose operon regulatory protein